MEDDLTQNGRRPHPKLEDDLTKMEDHLTKNGRRPHPKWKTTSTRIEDDKKQRLSKTKARRSKTKMIKMEDAQNGRRPKWNTTKIKED